jgi:hypothetical protein
VIPGVCDHAGRLSQAGGQGGRERRTIYIQRLQIDAISGLKQSLVTDMVAKQDKVTELQQAKSFL